MKNLVHQKLLTVLSLQWCASPVASAPCTRITFWDTTFTYRLVVGMARYCSQLEYLDSKFPRGTGTCFVMWHTCQNIAGYLGYWHGIQPSDFDRQVGQSMCGIIRSQVSVSKKSWDIGRNARGTKKHGWHYLTCSTTSAWPTVKRFVNTDL